MPAEKATPERLKELEASRIAWHNRIEALIGEQRIYVDLNTLSGDGTVQLERRGTFSDLERFRIELRDGLALAFWSDDVDDAGNEDPLLLEGVAHFDREKNRWVATVDADGIRNWSQDRKAGAL